MMKILIEGKPELINVKNDDGKTALHLAAANPGKFLTDILNFILS